MHASETRSEGGGGKGGGRPGSIWLGKHRQILNRQERELTSHTAPVTQRHRGGAHTAQTPRGTHRAHRQDHCQVQMQSHSLVLPAPPQQSGTDRNTAARPTHPLAGAVCMALNAADFRKQERTGPVRADWEVGVRSIRPVGARAGVWCGPIAPHQGPNGGQVPQSTSVRAQARGD